MASDKKKTNQKITQRQACRACLNQFSYVHNIETDRMTFVIYLHNIFLVFNFLL